MHLIAAQKGTIEEAGEAVDLGQTRGDVIVLSAADTELACLAAARAMAQPPFTLRLANLMRLSHPMSVDAYVERTARHAKLVVVRSLGGLGYFTYGLETLHGLARDKGVLLAALPGDDRPDPALAALSTVAPEDALALHACLAEGGTENAARFLALCAHLLGRGERPLPAMALPKASVVSERGDGQAGNALILFYRALVQAGQTRPLDRLAEALAARGMRARMMQVASLRDAESAAALENEIAGNPPDVILNATGFSVAAPGAERLNHVLDHADCPIFQVVLSGQSRDGWSSGTAGLSPKDLAMNVALPEVDGRILTRAISFKAAAVHDPDVEADIVTHEAEAGRIGFTADLAMRWAKLRRKPARDKRVAILLANYPNRDGRLANGVGLDTPAGTVEVLKALGSTGYALDGTPEGSAALMGLLRAGVTNATASGRVIGERLSLNDYKALFAALPVENQNQVVERWGEPGTDPMVADGAFALPFTRFGNVVVGIQPARGYNIDPKDSYHSPDLVPPHNYLAAYLWLRHRFGADAVIHMGKHGNLEWLPGKALALSETCWPEVALGPLPHLYPFIVNDPGEGTQAKRRAAAVIVDHLTPPLTRAETYGPLRDLEALVDEYYQALGGDPRRLKSLSQSIVALMASTGLDADLGLDPKRPVAEKLERLDAHLCDLKEMQIRDGLHVFGVSPDGRLADDLVTALARVPRGSGQGRNASLQRAIADDLGLGLDPLDCAMGEPWNGLRPAMLGDLSDDPWRITGDTVERIELLAAMLVAGHRPCPPGWTATAAVLEEVEHRFKPMIAACGEAEIAGLLAGLDGRFVSPGPSGAPTRGRPDVLPTGRNFYSADVRAVPSETAWALGRKSAELLVARYVQDHGEWPRAIALTAWGTANMRTGGDDIAQAFALIGAKPVWDGPSRRVTGFEIMPVGLLGRPRVDVTIRVSGFFRDAFPEQIALFDRAVRAVAALDEDDAENPVAARVKAEAARMEAKGMDAGEAALRAGFRVFGSKPGAYGAGLQAMIDERLWETADDLGEAFLVWGGYAYGARADGTAARDLLETRLAGTDAIIQNQDNREHDLLDSDDYYQFEGGLAAAAAKLTGRRPAIYHNDHSRPERPVIRTLEDEISRVVRARCVNPKWIAGVMRHGYKGAFEIAATLDYMFAFAATTGAVKSHHFDLAYEAWIADEHVRGFIAEANPDALREMADRFAEAIARGLWTPKSNSAMFRIENLKGTDA